MPEPRNPVDRTAVEQLFAEAPFIRSLGIELVDLGAGWCETRLDLAERHLQQHGFVHAGVQATIADHTAGAAASTLIAAGHQVLSVEFKLNLLRPARGEALRCRAAVLKGGRLLSVVESEVRAVAGAQETLVAKATVTLATVPDPRAATARVSDAAGGQAVRLRPGAAARPPGPRSGA
jgi:uncharacterized protein (TIGR00369 family)